MPSARRCPRNRTQIVREPMPNGEDDAGLSGGFSVVPREEKLRIVGIVETEPASGFGGVGRGRVHDSFAGGGKTARGADQRLQDDARRAARAKTPTRASPSA